MKNLVAWPGIFVGRSDDVHWRWRNRQLRADHFLGRYAPTLALLAVGRPRIHGGVLARWGLRRVGGVFEVRRYLFQL